MEDDKTTAVLHWLAMCGSDAPASSFPTFEEVNVDAVDEDKDQLTLHSSSSSRPESYLYGCAINTKKLSRSGTRSYTMSNRQPRQPAKSKDGPELQLRRSPRKPPTNAKTLSAESESSKTTPLDRNLNLAQPPSLRMFEEPLEDLSASTAGLEIESQVSIKTPLTSVSRNAPASTTTTSRKGRSQSPVKRKVDLRAAVPRIYYETKISPEVMITIKRFGKVIMARNVLPRSLKTDIEQLDNQGYLYSSDVEFDKGPLQPTEQDQLTFQILLRIREKSDICSDLSKPEASWGEEVYRPLLEHAIELANMKKNTELVLVENITTIPVAPQFVPRGINDIPLQAKQVDYGLFLSQTTERQMWLQNLFLSRNIAPEELGVNHTPVYAEYIRWLPHLLAIETKTNESTGISAEAQLGVWMAGLKNRLLKLLPARRETTLIPMPCVSVRGMFWEMYWATTTPNEEMIIYGPFRLGNTQTLLGTYCILAGLQELVRYAHEEYVPWLRRNCFGEDLD